MEVLRRRRTPDVGHPDRRYRPNRAWLRPCTFFDPLDIDTEPVDEPVSTQDLLSPFAQPGFAWAVDNQGLHLGWAHLYLRPADLAKLGNLYLDKGRWHGDQVVPAGWVQPRRAATRRFRATSRSMRATATSVGRDTAGEKAYSAVGFGGQRITVMPNRAAVIVTATQPDVRDPDAGISPEDFSLLADEIAPALREP